MIKKVKQILLLYGKSYDIVNKTLPFISVALILKGQLLRFDFLKNEICGNCALCFLFVEKLILSCNLPRLKKGDYFSDKFGIYDV